MTLIREPRVFGSGVNVAQLELIMRVGPCRTL